VIPEAALRGEDFRSPGASAIYARGLTIRTDGTRFWAGIYQDPDAVVPGRKWAVEMCVGESAGDLKVGIRLMTSSTNGRAGFHRSVPKAVRDILQQLSGYDGPFQISLDPVELSGPDGFATFESLAFSPKRGLPLIAISKEPRSGETSVNALLLARHLVGAAHVVVVDDTVSRALTSRHGKDWSVYLGAVRVYQPGAEPYKGDPGDHRYHKAEVIERINGGDFKGLAPFERQLADQILRETEKRFSGSSIPTFEAVETIAAQIARQNLESQAERDGAVSHALVESHRQEVESLRKMNEEANSLFETASEELKLAERDRDDAWGRNHLLQLEIERLRAALASRDGKGAASAAALQPPRTLDEICAFAETGLGSSVVVLPRAVKETRKTRNLNIARLYDGLVFLRDVYVPFRRGEISQNDYQTALRKNRFNEDACFSSPGSLQAFMGYTATWKGQQITLNRHLKWGVGSTDTMIRIYFYFDEETQSVIIGHMPSHLDNNLTS